MTNIKDYATSLIVSPPIPANTGTFLTVSSGHGARFPEAPFYATVHPALYMPDLDNAEKVLVTEVNGDKLTIKRGLGDTSAKYIVAGWRISNTFFTHDIAEPEKGEKGDKGDQGIQGEEGPTGPTGPQGEDGAQGIQGDIGPKGDTGSTGPQGMQGERGLKGEKGDKGETGEDSTVVGPTGPSIVAAEFLNDDIIFTKDDTTTVTLEDAKSELKGDQGIQGEAGPIGATGPSGITGPKGDRGDEGKSALDGFRELAGDPDATELDMFTALIGERGEKGVGISSIRKTEINGLIDTYTITYTDGSASMFNIANGNGISDIIKTNTTDLIDTYRINYTNGSYATFRVTNGEKGDTGPTIESAEFSGDDIIFTKDDSTTVELVGAKTTLKGTDGTNGADGVDGSSIVSAGFANNDIVFTNDKAEQITLTNAKTELKGDKGDNGGMTPAEKINFVKLDTEMQNFQNLITGLNPNQEAKQTITVANPVRLPNNVANGDLEISLTGFNAGIATPLRITSHSKNIWERETVLKGTDAVTSTSANTAMVGDDSFEFYSSGSSVANRMQLKPNTTYSLSGDFVGIKKVGVDIAFTIITRVYDGNKVSIGARIDHSQSSGKYTQTFTTSETGIMTFAVQSYTVFNVDKIILKNIQLEEAIGATSYVPSAKNALFIKDTLVLRSTPRYADEILKSLSGRYTHIKKVVSYTLPVSWFGTSPVISDETKNIKVFRVQNLFTTRGLPLRSSAATSDGYVDIGTTRISIVGGTTASFTGPEQAVTFSTNGLDVSVPFNTTLVNYATGKDIVYTYVVDEPINTNLDTCGTLIAYQSGLVTFEPVIADAGIYTTNFTALNTVLPMSKIDYVSKIDFNTGVETFLDKTKAVITGKTFTHPDLVNGDIVLVHYFYSLSKLNFTSSLTYFDSRHVIKDTVTNVYYKWNVKVTNGVASINLEVA